MEARNQSIYSIHNKRVRRETRSCKNL